MEITKLFKRHRGSHISYDFWGWIFLIPFFTAFFVFSLIPLIKTFIYSFQDYYYSSITFQFEGPTFCGWNNYAFLFTNGSERSYYLFDQVIGTWFMADIWYYLLNTLIIFILGFVPQIVISLALSIWFTDARLKIRGTQFFKTVMYMPNLIMAAAFGMLFQLLFSMNGPVNQVLIAMGVFHQAYSFKSSEFWCRAIIALINLLMWFGNTTLLLMSGVMGIDDSIFESALLDGSSAHHTFWKITFPLLRPIFIYVFITSLIGGIQLFDTAYMFTNGSGGPNLTSNTIMQYLYTLIHIGENYGLSGALSVMMFVLTAVLSMAVYWTTRGSKNPEKEAKKAQAKRYRIYRDCASTQDEMLRRGYGVSVVSAKPVEQEVK
jgi:cellobiose transport system permease protein